MKRLATLALIPVLAACSAPAPEVVTVEKTPASCIEALDLNAEVMVAIATEHAEISAAATKASKTMNVTRFAEDVAAAMQKAGNAARTRQDAMTKAIADCRAKA